MLMKYRWFWTHLGAVLVFCRCFSPTAATAAAAREDTLVDALLGNLTHSSQHLRGEAMKRLSDLKNPAAIPALIELLRFDSVFQVSPVATLEQLTNQKFGDDWGKWVEWLQRHEEIHPTENFLAWKANLYSRIDPAFENFLYPGVSYRIRLEEIVWGGVRKDGIPALVNPKHVKPTEATYLTPQELVFGVSIAGDSRAYPLRILDWHEMFNDVVGGKPITLSY